MPKAGFYAVRKGRNPGIYSTWEECKAQVDGFHKAEFKRFGNLKDAETFIGVAPSTSASVPAAPSTSAVRFKPYPTATSIGKAKVEDSVTKLTNGDDWTIAYTDGACRGNGRPDAVAGIGVWYGDNDPRNVSERCPGDQTNNRAELIAIIRCLETDLDPNQSLLIKSDSKYAMDCVTKWMPGWERNGWRTKDKKDVANKPVIQHLANLLAERPGPVKFEYVKGHSGEKGNDGADRLAVMGVSRPRIQEREWVTSNAQKKAPAVTSSQSRAGRISALPSNIEIVEQSLPDLDGPLFDDDELKDL